MTFNTSIWEKLLHTKKEQLKNIAQNFFHLLHQFAKLKKSTKMNIVIVENNLQEITSGTYGIFQLYFYKNLFDPSVQSKIVNHKSLTIETIKTLLNEIFTTETQETNTRLNNLSKNFCKY